jgi:hypothetical protein
MNTLVSVTFCRELGRAPKPFCPTISNCAAHGQRMASGHWQTYNARQQRAYDVAKSNDSLVWGGACSLSQHFERGEAAFVGGGDHIGSESLAGHAPKLLVVRVRGVNDVISLPFAVGGETRAQQPRGRLGNRRARVVRLQKAKVRVSSRTSRDMRAVRAPCSTARTVPRQHRPRTGTAAAAASATASAAAHRLKMLAAQPSSRCLRRGASEWQAARCAASTRPWHDTARRAQKREGGWRRGAPWLHPATPLQHALGAARFWQLDATAQHMRTAPQASPQKT